MRFEAKKAAQPAHLIDDFDTQPAIRAHHQRVMERDRILTNMTTPDPVNYPPQYNRGRIEVIDFIEDQQLGFHLGNVVKYICREYLKGGIVDLQKAQWYLQREIQRRTR